MSNDGVASGESEPGEPPVVQQTQRGNYSRDREVPGWIKINASLTMFISNEPPVNEALRSDKEAE